MVKGISSLILVVAFLAQPVFAQDFATGQAAYERGDYATALREWRPFAEQGNVEAQVGLGFIHYTGDGERYRDKVESYRWFRKAAEQGNATAQYMLGQIYYFNVHPGAEDNPDVEAVRWYRKAAEQGHSKAQYKLGYMYDVGRGVPENESEAEKWYNRSAEGNLVEDGYEKGIAAYDRKDYAEALRLLKPFAEQGYADAQNKLGVMYDNGAGVSEDDVEAMRWYRKAADQGNANAQYSLGSMYQFGVGLVEDYAEAVRWYRRAADQGNANAQYSLGSMYQFGVGLTEDYAVAVRWYRKAAEQGHATAELDLGVMYARGEGVTQDKAEAVRWYRKAAEHGHSIGQLFLAQAYDFGTGVTEDDVEAVRWYRKAAEQRNALAQDSLGSMYQFGEGVAEDYTEAARWYRKAVDQGDAQAQFDLAKLYESGQGVKKSNAEAARLYWLAARQEEEVSGKARELLDVLLVAAPILKLDEGGENDAPPTFLNWYPDGREYLTLKNVNIRLSPRISGKNIGTLKKGSSVGAIGIVEDRPWVLIDWKGQVAYIHSELLEIHVPRIEVPTNKHAVAVILGNRDYGDPVPDVEYAANDADAMRSFVIDQLGYRDGNIIDLRDATQSQITAVFGNRVSHEGKLWSWVKPGKSDVTVFYSGHGVPGIKDKRGYLLPVDADPEVVELNGYPLDLLLKNLAKIEAHSTTVYIDACFSGESPKGRLIQAVSGLSIEPRMPVVNSGMTIITAATGSQVASWDPKAKHGLFTKHLLDALAGAADKGDYGNGDGKITVGEVKKYLDDEMTYAAQRNYGRVQTATINGNADTVLSVVR
jgi:uncharacterized protein